MAIMKPESDKLWGKYRAEVIDNNDDLKRGRVKVKCIQLADSSLGWAESCLVPNLFTLPRVGDFVWIEFEGGDIEFPIWTGIMPTRDYFKNYLFEDFGSTLNYDHLVSIFRTSNFTIYIQDDDLQGNEKLIIRDKAGSKIEMDTKNGGIKMFANSDVKIAYGGQFQNGKVEDIEPYTSHAKPKKVKDMGVE